jgi:multimeric flavodoxin WrbA
LIDISTAILEKNGVSVECIRPVDDDIASGVWPDMMEHGWDNDDWPRISREVMAADILVIGSSIWLGEKTSVCTKVY